MVRLSLAVDAVFRLLIPRLDHCLNCKTWFVIGSRGRTGEPGLFWPKADAGFLPSYSSELALTAQIYKDVWL